MGTLTYLDSSVLINLFSRDKAKNQRALVAVEREERSFLWSNCLKLEVLPKPIRNKFQEQVDYYLDFFRDAAFVPITDAIFEKAQELAVLYDLNPLDALLVAGAIAGNAAEFITFEKPSKPFFQIPSRIIKLTSLY